MSILVTGGCGALGSAVLLRLLRRQPTRVVINLDAMTYASNPEADALLRAYPNYRLYVGNVCDPDIVSYVLRREAPEVVLHLAAETHVDNSFGNSLAFTRSNVLGTHTMLECVRRHNDEERNGGGSRGGVRKFVHMSTDEVYGSVPLGEPARTEDALFAPSNPYAATKAAAEMICQAYHRSFQLPIVVARCNNIVSEWQHPEKLIPAAFAAFAAGRRMPIHGDGQSRRAFISAMDVADALDVIAERGRPGQVYNIGTAGTEHTVLEVVQKVLALVRGDQESLQDWVVHVPDRAFQDQRYMIDSTALRAIGWTGERDDLDTSLLKIAEHHSHVQSHASDP